MTDKINALSLQASAHPRPLTLEDLKLYDLVYSAPPGFPLLTDKQAKLIRQRAENPTKTWKACAAAVGYAVSSQNAGRSLLVPNVKMYLDALSHGQALVESATVGTPAELRASAMRTLVKALADPDLRNGTMAAKVLLDALPATDASDVSVLGMSDDDLIAKIQSTIRELGDIDLRLAVCVPPEPIAAPQVRQVVPDMSDAGPSPIAALDATVGAQDGAGLDMQADDEQGGGIELGADPPKTDAG